MEDETTSVEIPALFPNGHWNVAKAATKAEIEAALRRVTSLLLTRINKLETRLAKQEQPPPLRSVQPDPGQPKHFTAAELGKLWGFSHSTIRRLFENEPGVLRIGEEKSRRVGRKYVRRKTSMRIPEDVAQRVHDRLSAKTRYGLRVK